MIGFSLVKLFLKHLFSLAITVCSILFIHYFFMLVLTMILCICRYWVWWIYGWDYAVLTSDTFVGTENRKPRKYPCDDMQSTFFSIFFVLFFFLIIHEIRSNKSTRKLTNLWKTIDLFKEVGKILNFGNVPYKIEH